MKLTARNAKRLTRLIKSPIPVGLMELLETHEIDEIYINVSPEYGDCYALSYDELMDDDFWPWEMSDEDYKKFPLFEDWLGGQLQNIRN